MARSLIGRQRQQRRRRPVDPCGDAAHEAPQPMRADRERAGVTDRQAQAVDSVAAPVGRIGAGRHSGGAQCGAAFLGRLAPDAEGAEFAVDPGVGLVHRREVRMGDQEVVVVARVEDPVDLQNRPVHRQHRQIRDHRDDRRPHRDTLQSGELRAAGIPDDGPDQRRDQVPGALRQLTARASQRGDLPQDGPQCGIGSDRQAVAVVIEVRLQHIQWRPGRSDPSAVAADERTQCSHRGRIGQPGQVGVHPGQAVAAGIAGEQLVERRTHDMVGEGRHMCRAGLVLALQGPEVDRLRPVVPGGHAAGDGASQAPALGGGVEVADPLSDVGEGLTALLALGEDAQDDLFVGCRFCQTPVDVDGFNHGRNPFPGEHQQHRNAMPERCSASF